MYGKIQQHLQNELNTIQENGLFKKERIITSPQGAEITISTGETVLNFCANNYLGLSSHPEVVQAAKDALDSHGFGMSSVRFICGTQDIHKTLEQKIESVRFHKGFTGTAGGFYGPQGRVLRLEIQDSELNNKMDAFEFEGTKMTNLEMETAAIYGLGKLLGHNCLSLNAIIANRANGTFSADPYKAVDELIAYTLQKLSE